MQKEEKMINSNRNFKGKTALQKSHESLTDHLGKSKKGYLRLEYKYMKFITKEKNYFMSTKK